MHKTIEKEILLGQINQDMEQHIKRCERCIRFKAKQEIAPLENIEPSYPMELVHIDYLTIESNKTEKDINILVVTDHQTSPSLCNTITESICSSKTLWTNFSCTMESQRKS